MSNLRQAAQQALEAMADSRRSHHYCEDTWYSCPKHEGGCANEAEGDECNCGADKANEKIDQAITAIEQALAEPEQKPVAWYCNQGLKRGVSLKQESPEWMPLYTALKQALAEPEQEPFMVVSSECAERGCMAHDDRVDGSGIVVQLRKEQEEVRRLHAELERKSDAIQRLWKERDELRAVLTKIVGSK